MTNTYVKIFTLDPVFAHSTFLAAYTWPTSKQALDAFTRAKALFSVELLDAAYAANLYLGRDKLLDSFWMGETGLKDVRKTCWTEASLFHEVI